MKTLQTTLIATIVIFTATAMTACTSPQKISNPTTNSKAKTLNNLQQSTVQKINLQGLLGWIEADCGEGIQDENSALGRSRTAYFQFTESPKSSQYSAFVSNAAVNGQQGILSMQDSRTTTINFKNATFHGVPVDKIIVKEGYEFYEETLFFSGNIATLKPHFKTSMGLTKFNTSNNSITCESMMM